MRARPVEEILADGVSAEGLILRYTAGSTGEPTRVRRTEVEDHLLQLFRIRAMRLAGARLTDRTLSVASRGVPTDNKPRSAKRSPGGWASCAPNGSTVCSRSTTWRARCVGSPDVVVGYAAVITEIAEIWPDVRGEPAIRA
jgi:phenylacetate-coenzyme A ligase PaaK-like adenylate-forming protein